jgi:hypothetical protein
MLVKAVSLAGDQIPHDDRQLHSAVVNGTADPAKPTPIQRLHLDFAF